MLFWKSWLRLVNRNKCPLCWIPSAEQKKKKGGKKKKGKKGGKPNSDPYTRQFAMWNKPTGGVDTSQDGAVPVNLPVMRLCTRFSRLRHVPIHS